MEEDAKVVPYREIVREILFYGAGWLLVLSVAITGFQIYLWLKNGYWVELPLIHMFEYAPNFRNLTWIYQPSSWLGVHKVISYILNMGIAGVTFLLAVIVFLIGIQLPDQQAKIN